jgi:toxin YoeB
MAKGIVWTESAKKDRIDILTFWINRTQSKKYSQKLNEIFVNRSESLLIYPFLGKQTEIESIRCLPFGDYSFFYQISSSQVIIHRIWSNKQNPELFTL